MLRAAYQPDRINAATQDRLLDAGNRLWFSAVSIWEVAIKLDLGRADFTIDPGRFRAGLLQSDYSELAMESRHCLGLATLPALHGDPFERMLVVQATAEGMVLLTADACVAAYGRLTERI